MCITILKNGLLSSGSNIQFNKFTIIKDKINRNISCTSENFKRLIF